MWFVALLAASCSVFLQRSTEEYIQSLWLALVNQQDPASSFHSELVCTVHICRIHINRFWKRKVERTFPRRMQHVVELYLQWMHLFIRTKTIESIRRRIIDLLVISGNEYYTAEVHRCIQNLRDPMEYLGTFNSLT